MFLFLLVLVFFCFVFVFDWFCFVLFCFVIFFLMLWNFYLRDPLLTLKCIRGVHLDPTFRFSRLLGKDVFFFLISFIAQFFNRFFFLNFILQNINVFIFFYFEPNFIVKVLWESGVFSSNFGHVTFFEKRKFVIWPPFCNGTFFEYSFCWFMVVLGVNRYDASFVPKSLQGST